MDNKPIVMHFPTDMVLDYGKKMLANIKENESTPAEIAMFEDIVTMLEVAHAKMISVPGASGKKSK